MAQKKLGLIGKNISYSFSKKYFENKFRNLMIDGYTYDLFDLDTESEIEELLKTPNLRGVNVTIPYKEKVQPFLDELSEEARETGAVNCILIKDNIKKGFNTDAFGFERTLLLHRKEKHQSALILGNGGAAKAVKYVLQKLMIPYKTVARKEELTFDHLDPETVAAHRLIIQCTPVGTFPNVNDCLSFPFEALSADHLVIDLIYNPAMTAFLQNSAQHNAKTVNGLYMLEQQAEKAWKIWNF